MLGTRRLPGRPLILVGVAAGTMIAGAGVAMAAASGSPASQAVSVPAASGTAATPAPAAPGRPGKHHGHHHGHKGKSGFGGPFGAVHGQFVVPRPGGGYQAIDAQRGVVTAVSAASITVKSSDGFVRTYQVTSSTQVDARRDGIGSVRTGDQAVVLAAVSGPTATATQILDVSLLPKMHPGPGWKHPGP